MKGTWGRRVFGRIIKGDTNTVFILEIDMGYDSFRRLDTVESAWLKQNPDLYKKVLDSLTFQLEQDIKKYNQTKET